MSAKTNRDLIQKIRRLETLYVAYKALNFVKEKVIDSGLELNRTYENISLGLAALTAAKTKAIDVNGKELKGMKQLQVLQLQTKDTLDLIKKASLDTPATFVEMAGFYQQAIGHALASNKAFGASLDEIQKNTIQLTKRMSNLGSAAGMSMDLINEEIRSLMSGSVSSDSKLALILFGNPAAANKAIKEAKLK